MPRCHARSKHGPCKASAIKGGVVCGMHGGRAPQVKRKAAQRLADLIDPDRALREAARLAYSDLSELYDDQSRLKPVKDWPKDLKAAVGRIKTLKHNETAGDGKQETVVEVQLWDKPRALEMLFKHLGLLRERLEVDVSEGLVERLLAGRRRVAEDRSKYPPK